MVVLCRVLPAITVMNVQVLDIVSAGVVVIMEDLGAILVHIAMNVLELITTVTGAVVLQHNTKVIYETFYLFHFLLSIIFYDFRSRRYY